MDNSLKQIVNQIKEVENPLGTFIIDGDLGEGGTAVVKRARLNGDVSGRTYAVKLLMVNIVTHKSTEYKKFRQAYINLASIQHLGCCISLLYFGEYEYSEKERNFKIPYIVMCVADHTMEKHFTIEEKKGKRHRTASYDEFQMIFNRLGEIIQLIHDNGIIHRDIKPQNIFYYSDKLYLADFDISKFEECHNYIEAKTKKGDRLANINFSAPEQFDSSMGEICNESDWFAFAQVMIWLMVGTPILKGFKKVSLHGSDKRFRPYEILFEKLLQTNPKQRLGSFAAIKQYLKDNDNELKQQAQQRAENLRQGQVRECLCQFLQIIDFYTPEFNGCWQANLITRRDEISDLLGKINGLMSENDFGIVFKGGDIHNVKFFKSTQNCLWIFSGYESVHFELSISGVIAYQHHNLGASFAVIVGQQMAREFDVNGTSCMETFLRYHGHMLSPDVGQSARIDGKLVAINSSEVEHVVRFVESGIYFLGPLESPLNSNFEKFKDVCESFSSVQSLIELLTCNAFADHIIRPESVRMYD